MKLSPTITLSMICKDSLANLKRLQPLVQPYVDEWIIVFPPNDPAIDWAKQQGITSIVEDFTQEIEPEIRAKMASVGVELDEGYRLFNFAAARNRALQEASWDYILWLDDDDEPVGMENLKEVLAAHPTNDVFDAVYDYYRDEEGNSISDHVRERIIKNTGDYAWKGGELGLIHETLLPKQESYQPFRYDIPSSVFKVIHHTDHVDQSSLRNHAALLYEYIKTKGKDPRTTYYLGTEFFNRGDYDNAIRTLREYIKVSGWDEEKYHAWIKVGNAYRMLGDNLSARNAYLAAVDEMPHYPHAYLSIGESYHDDEEWAKAIEFILTGLGKQLPKTKYVTDVTSLTFRPAVYVALSYLQLGKPGSAYEWFQKAVKMNPNHPWLKQYAATFQDAKDLDDYVRAFVKLGQLSQRLYPQTLSKLADVVPDELMDQELLMDFKWRYKKPKVWPKNSIVYWCSSAFEEWGPDSLKTGTGGSEEAVIQLTKRWAKLGYDVTVYNNCPTEGTFDGVKWVRYERFNPGDVFNVLISWRNNIFTQVETAQTKLIDMHDVPTSDVFSGKAVEGCTIMAKSQYHASLFPDVPKEQFTIIPNGVELKTLQGGKKVKHNLCWTSSYDRGLERLLNMWPQIREAVPDATLDVAYGFNLYDTSPWGRTKEGQQWKQRMLKLLEQDGITHHGRLPSQEVAKLYKKAQVFAYPTDFPEIDCISLTKVQAAGVYPVTSDFAVMPERNQGTIVKEGEDFVQPVIDALNREDTPTFDVKQYDWDTIATTWIKEMKLDEQ